MHVDTYQTEAACVCIRTLLFEPRDKGLDCAHIGNGVRLGANVPNKVTADGRALTQQRRAKHRGVNPDQRHESGSGELGLSAVHIEVIDLPRPGEERVGQQSGEIGLAGALGSADGDAWGPAVCLQGHTAAVVDCSEGFMPWEGDGGLGEGGHGLGCAHRDTERELRVSGWGALMYMYAYVYECEGDGCACTQMHV